MEAVMPEPLQNVAYLCDGTVEGYLTCIFQAYTRKEHPEDITTEASYQPRFEQSALYIQTEFEQAQRVGRGIRRKGGASAFLAVVRALSSCVPNAGMVAFRFVRHLMDPDSNIRGRAVLDDLANPVVGDLVALQKRVVNEEERMLQFVRFSHLENGVWFARCNPNANVVPLVMGHFAARFNVQPFIIYDETHHIAGVYDGQSWNLVEGEAVAPVSRTAHDAYIEALWQEFYEALTIKDRYNPELRRHFIPVRLWRNLPELSSNRTRSLVAPINRDGLP